MRKACLVFLSFASKRKEKEETKGGKKDFFDGFTKVLSGFSHISSISLVLTHASWHLWHLMLECRQVEHVHADTYGILCLYAAKWNTCKLTLAAPDACMQPSGTRACWHLWRLMLACSQVEHVQADTCGTWCMFAALCNTFKLTLTASSACLYVWSLCLGDTAKQSCLHSCYGLLWMTACMIVIKTHGCHLIVLKPGYFLWEWLEQVID